MVANCTALIGYKTYPHTDMHIVGRQIGRILLDSLAGKCRPVMAWGNRPLLAQTLRMGTADEPMKSLAEAARAAETGPILAATVFGGFPLADMPDAGLSAIIVADGDRPVAEQVRDTLLDRAWAGRDEFLYAASRSTRLSRARHGSKPAQCCCSTTPIIAARAGRRTS